MKRNGVWRPPGCAVYMMKLSVDGQVTRESTEKRTEEEAIKVRQQRLDELRRGDSVPHEARLTVADLRELIADNYDLRENSSKDTMLSTWKHLESFFGPKCRVSRVGPRVEKYVAHRKAEGSPVGSIRAELAFLDRAFHLAVQKKRLSHRARPYIEKPPVDPRSVRRGFFHRETVERLCALLAAPLADVVLFLFFCPWRIGAARRLEWRDYDEADEALTLRPELNKTGYELRIPVDDENTPELKAVIERQQARRRPDCPFIFHGRDCGKPPRFDKKGRRRPCLGDFQKAWNRPCIALGYHRPDPDHPDDPKKVKASRTPHDLRRSGIKHYIDAGVDPHTVMEWSGHRTAAMLRRYHIIDLDDLRRAGKMASNYRGPKAVVTPLRSTTGTKRAQVASEAI